MRSRWWRVVVVVLVVAVAVGVYAHKASTRKNETEKDTSPLRSLMLTRQDIPDATDITWPTGTEQMSICYADSMLDVTVSRTPETSLTIEHIETGGASVTEALVLNINEPSPGNQARWLRDAVTDCDGITSAQPFLWPSSPTPSSGQDVSMTITLLDPAGLPDGAFGFHQTATATRATTVNCDILYAPVMHEDQRGIIMVRTAVPDDGTPAPDITDLLTTALHRADATLDPAQLTPPAPSPTTSPTP